MQNAWNLFKVRRALLTSGSLRLMFPGGIDVGAPEILRAASSILYINLLSLFDEATATQLTAGEFSAAGKLARRIAILNERGSIADFGELTNIRRRRNELGHEPAQDATVDELNHAFAVVQRQLVAWGLVSDERDFTLGFERTAMRRLTADILPFEHDHIAKVMNGDQVVYEVKQTFTRLPFTQAVGEGEGE